MAQFGKSTSSKKGKPSYFMAIMGVTIVLFIWGVFGLIMIYVNKYRQKSNENIKLFVSVRDEVAKDKVNAFMTELSQTPYANQVTYKDKEAGKQEMIAEQDTTIDFSLMDGQNPLPNLVVFNLKPQYVQEDSVKNIKAALMQRDDIVNNIEYSKDVVKSFSSFFKNLAWIFLFIAFILTLLVILLIDNTIKLAMYSNRFLIKTMQMVGATRWFIAKPIDTKAIINGAISGAIACVALFGAVKLFERQLPDLKMIHDGFWIPMLFVIIFVVSIIITLLSTHRAVNKYLKMKLDDLY